MSQPADPVRLDYRGLGSFMVLLAIFVFAWNGLPAAGWTGGALTASAFGSLAVMLFLVLSGVFVTEVALRFYQGRPAAFFANRLLRLWIPYLVALLLAIAIVAVSGDRTQQLLQPANLLANVVAIFPSVVLTDSLLGVRHRADLIPMIWTLRPLFVFYLVVTLVLLLRRPARLLPLLLAAGLAAHLVLYYFWSPTPRATLYGGLAIHFVLGSAIGLRLNGRLSGKFAVVLLTLGGVLSFLHALTFRTADPGAMGFANAIAPERFWAMGGALVLLGLLWLFRRRPATRAALVRQRLLAGLALPIYLLHWPALLLTLWLWPVPHWSNLLLALALTLLLAAAMQALLGPPLARWRSRVRQHGAA